MHNHCTTSFRCKPIKLRLTLKKVDFGCTAIQDCSSFRELSVLWRDAFRHCSRIVLPSFCLLQKLLPSLQLLSKFAIKPALTIDQQIDLLEKRGLLIPDHERAHRHLSNISYYRLSAYMLPRTLNSEKTGLIWQMLLESKMIRFSVHGFTH